MRREATAYDDCSCPQFRTYGVRPDYWLRQSVDTPLFPDIEFSRPEQKAQAGKLLIIGGNKLGFSAVANAYSMALKTGAGAVKVVLPDVLRSTLPKDAAMDTVFLPSNPSGGFSRDGLVDIIASADWADGILLIGDSGQNSETAVLFEDLLGKTDKQITITRDAFDLLRHVSEKLAGRPHTTLILSFSQTQKLFSSVYYPKVLTFSMQLAALVDALHKFTITYPLTLQVFHHDTLLLTSSGHVVTTAFDTPMAIWNGSVAARTAVWQMWNQTKPLEAIATSWVAK